MITDKSIELIAEQLGIATEQIYEVFVAAQPTIAVIQAICIAFIVTLAITGYALTLKLKWDCDPTFMALIFGILGVMLSIAMYECMKCYFLPEYAALVKLMELAFGGTIR